MSDMKTAKEILKGNGINVDELEQDKPMLLNNILRAMDDFADQYHNWKKSKANVAYNKQGNDHIQVVRFSEARAEVCKKLSHWKTCESWTNDCRCLASCIYHLQT